MRECKSCGYMYDFDWIKGKKIILKGDKDFLELRIEGHTFKHGEDFYYLIACPKCGTVKMEM